MSLISDRYECDRCGGYRLPFRSTLSSRCRCPDYAPVEPGYHQIGRPAGARIETRPTTKGPRDAQYPSDA